MSLSFTKSTPTTIALLRPDSLARISKESPNTVRSRKRKTEINRLLWEINSGDQPLWKGGKKWGEFYKKQKFTYYFYIKNKNLYIIFI